MGLRYGSEAGGGKRIVREKKKEKEKERKRGTKEESEEAGEGKEVIKKKNGVRDFGVKFRESFCRNLF